MSCHEVGKVTSRMHADELQQVGPTGAPPGRGWERARGWALSQAVGALTHYTPENNPSLYHEGEARLAVLQSERG
jgi:hypothetical protein